MQRIIRFSLILFVYLIAIPVAGQDSITVIAIQANLRGTPNAKGVVVTQAKQGERFSLIKQEGVWFLVQTPVYVGWMHGSTIRIDDSDEWDSTSSTSNKPSVVPTTPTTTSKPITGDSPFTEQYIGGDSKPTITVRNEAGRIVTLIFGGVTYEIPIGNSIQITVEEGNYEFRASAPRANPLSGVKSYRRGYLYSWTFFIRRS